jgi:hypothetical protein
MVARKGLKELQMAVMWAVELAVEMAVTRAV